MVAQMQIKMPESIDHEEAILHCMFIGVCRPTETRLSESDFFSSSCRTIFSFAMRAEAAGSDVTGAIPLFPMMREAGVFEMIGGLQYIQHITTGVVCSHDWKRTVKFLKELSRRREAVAGYIKAAHAMSVEQYDTYSERCDAASSEIARVEAALSHGQTSGLRHASEMITGWLDELDERKERKPGEVVGFSTGFAHLDEKLYPKGVLAGALVAIGARPKMGKTAFLTKWVNHTALDQGKAACVFSLEMTRTSLLERSIVQRDSVKDVYDGDRLVSRAIQGTDFWDPRVLNGRAGQLADEAYLRSSAIAADIGNSKLYIDDTPGVSLRHIVSECRRIAKKEGSIGLIAVDYLTLMKAEKAERNDLAYGEITKGLKNLAKEMRCPVLLLTQLNRKLEDRNDKRPMPSDSRDTGQIEQDCDLWIGLFRQSAYTPDGMPGSTSKLAEVIVRLNREGYTGTIYIDFSGGKFSDIDQDEGVRLAGEIEHWLNPPKTEKQQGKIKGGF